MQQLTAYNTIWSRGYGLYDREVSRHALSPWGLELVLGTDCQPNLT